MTLPSDSSEIADGIQPSHSDANRVREKWTITQRLLYQFIATEVISILGHGLDGHWLAGIFAPIWAVVLPFCVYGPFSDSITRQMLIPAILILVLLLVIVLALRKKIRVIWGHIALLLFNIMSIFLLLAID